MWNQELKNTCHHTRAMRGRGGDVSLDSGRCRWRAVESDYLALRRKKDPMQVVDVAFPEERRRRLPEVQKQLLASTKQGAVQQQGAPRWKDSALVTRSNSTSESAVARVAL